MLKETELTPGLKKCLLSAYNEAAVGGRRKITAEQILLILLENAAVQKVLFRFSINIQVLHMELINHINANELMVDEINVVEPEISASLGTVLRIANALRFYKTGKSEPISEIDVLVALVTDDRTKAANLLSIRGVSLEKLLCEVILEIDPRRF